MRWIVGLSLGLLLAAAVWWSMDEPSAPLAPQPPPTAAPAKWTAPVEPKGERTLQGTVVGAGQPVPGAIVTAVLARVDDVSCGCRPAPLHRLMACASPESTPAQIERITARRGEAVPVGRATTDAEGRFTLMGLESATLTLWAEAPGAIGWTTNVRSDATGVRIQLTEGRKILGTVKQPDGSPAAGALVTAVFGEQNRFFDARADATGRFSIGPVPIGQHVVIASLADFVPDRRVVPGEARSSLALELGVERALSGRVVRGGVPVANAQVTLEGPQRRWTATSDGSGQFRFEHVRQGDYALEATIDAELAQTTATVSRFEDRRDVELELRPGRRLQGVVLDTRGTPLADVALSIDDTGGAPQCCLDGIAWRTARTTADGRFTLPTVNAGRTNTVRAKKAGFISKAQTITTTEDVTLTLEDAAVLTGRVLTPFGEVVPTFRVTARPLLDGGPVPTLTVNDIGIASSTDGGFSLDLKPGAWQLQVEAVPHATIKTNAIAPGSVTITLEPGAEVYGRVTDLDGRPAPERSFVRCASVDGQPSRFSWTDAEGGYVVQGLAAGRYEIEATVSADRQLGWSASSTFTVRGGERVEQNLRPLEGERVSGVVVNGQGQPIAGVRVSGLGTPMNTGIPTDTTVSDEEGRFSMRTFAAGTVRLTASGPGLAPVKLNVTAPDTNVVLKVNEPSTIRGRVVDEQRSPVKTFSVRGKRFDTEDGRFIAPLASKDEAELFIDADGFARKFLPISEKEGRVELGDVVLSRGRFISGVVTDRVTGAAIEGALVEATPGRPLGFVPLADRRNVVRTGLDGRFELKADPSTGWLVVVHEGYAQRVERLSGSSTVRIALEEATTLSVSVLNANGLTIENARVTATQGDDVRRAVLNAAGTYVARGLGPGSWVVSADVANKIIQPITVVAEGGAQRVRLRESNGTALKIVMPEADEFLLVSGVVSAPVNAAAMQAWPSQQFIGDGAERVPPGTWTLVGLRGEPGAQEVTLHPIEITSAQATLELTLTPRWMPVRN